VKKQVECGIDIVSDGEMSKAGFFTYIRERLEGFESRPNEKVALFQKEVSAFPEYYEQYFKEAMLGGALVPLAPVVCIGPVKYVGEAALLKDIANLKAAAKAAGVPDEQIFMPATAASGVGRNEYYKTEEEYFHSVAAALRHEYEVIVAAGFLLQVDDPFLPDIFFEPGLSTVHPTPSLPAPCGRAATPVRSTAASSSTAGGRSLAASATRPGGTPAAWSYATAAAIEM